MKTTFLSENGIEMSPLGREMVGTTIYVAVDGKMTDALDLADQLRPGAKEAVARPCAKFLAHFHARFFRHRYLNFHYRRARERERILRCSIIVSTNLTMRELQAETGWPFG